MPKDFWCWIGLHKWGRATYHDLFSSNVRDWKKYCLKCKKVKTWVEPKKVEEWE